VILAALLAIKIFTPTPEIQLGFLVVIAIIALITLLFLVAAGFAQLQLTDPKQPLGLPEGSIRAMIALILIMVFIIFGIHLFRVTGVGLESGPVEMTYTELAAQSNISFIEKVSDGKFKVWLKADLSDDGVRLAQQLLTTVGTLVVAVAGFYFGSSAVSSAAAAVRGLPAARPMIGGITPAEGRQNQDVPLTITGQNFQIPRAVRLVRGAEEIAATDVMASATRITGILRLAMAPGGDNWDVVIQNEDGTETRLERAFRINPP
jgi:hypothetical protein